MILTLTINPAVDRNVTVDRLAFEDRGYILSRDESAGGRGINASHVIHSFGGKTMAVAVSGGEAGKLFESLTKSSGFPMQLVRIAHEMRTNLTITDKQGLTVKLNELGPPLSTKELDSVAEVVEENLDKATWFMICGSVPPGVPPHFYNHLLDLAHKKKVKTLLDTDGDALLHGLEAGPTVVCPNQQEAERLLNRALITRTHLVEAVERIHGMGAQSVVLSLGSRGAMGRTAKELIEAAPPRIDADCPIGAGDALAAAFTWAIDKKKDFADAVRWGVAAGTASAKLPGITFANLEQTKQIYPNVDVRAIA
ncbi:MAG TPA: 1-phosphofructokinase family hexose kinase [Bryobacteraceae bacterium]|nr:1-phosphofructokinase family hexose kinase [Bryobacteraceae bacterium]